MPGLTSVYIDKHPNKKYNLINIKPHAQKLPAVISMTNNVRHLLIFRNCRHMIWHKYLLYTKPVFDYTGFFGVFPIVLVHQKWYTK